ncbi:ABC transporter substrate-binding protein [Mesorhizobium sp. B2-4-13]|uniref:ABC transporter substrate-binding protein n=1 Tax=Mesorhizobium sp. B2-4-13 TaxID=2589936 RepID=UPI0015EE5F7E|nr:ABC transporter substrate-binding protein [Mesorhizobium sp. B2-4-13]
MRQLSLLGSAAGTALMLTVTGAASARDLTIVGGEGDTEKVIVRAIKDPFVKETGIQIASDIWTGSEIAKIKAMVDTGSYSWDVLTVEAPELARGCEDGIFQPIDFSKVGGKDRFIPNGATECGAGFISWAMLMAYNPGAVKAAPRSWADFFDLARNPGKRGLRKTAKMTLEIALLGDGVAPDQIYNVLRTEEGVKRAFAKLESLGDQVEWWSAGAQPQQWLSSGEVVMTAAYNGRVALAADAGQKVATNWNGAQYSVDYYAIPKGDPLLDKAYAYVEFATRAGVQAAFSEGVPYGPANAEAAKKVNNPNLPTYPANFDVSVFNDTDFWIENGAALEERFQAWVAAR